MEIFSQPFATAYSRSYAAPSEEISQDTFEPQNRLTNRELCQLRSIREEIASRPRRTRFEERYIKLLREAELELCGIRPDCRDAITKVRDLLKQAEFKTDVAQRSIIIALLCGAIAKYTK